jgi:hypothetical protein
VRVPLAVPAHAEYHLDHAVLILKTLVPQRRHTPAMAGLPFIIVTGCGFDHLDPLPVLRPVALHEPVHRQPMTTVSGFRNVGESRLKILQTKVEREQGEQPQQGTGRRIQLHLY